MDFDGFDVSDATGGGDFDGFDVDAVEGGDSPGDVGEGTDADVVKAMLDPFVESGDLDPDVAEQIVENWNEWDEDWDALWEVEYEAPDDGDGYI